MIFRTAAICFIASQLFYSCSGSDNEYYELATDYADFMIEQGLDTYGEIQAPVFLSMLDRTTNSIINNPEESVYFDRATTGIRVSDRSLNGANPFNDEGLYNLLYMLSEETKDPKYEQAADQSLSWLIRNTQHPETKLIGWGEHLGYRCDLDQIVRHPDSNWGDLKHEIHGYWTLWPKVFELEPSAAIDYAYGFWNYHVYDQEAGIHAHQTRYDTFEPDSGYVFPRMAGHMIYLWSLAYKTTDDQKVKTDMIGFIDKIVTTHNQRRNAVTKVLPFLHPKEGVVYKPYGNIESAYEIHRSFSLNLPDSIQNKLRQFTSYTDGCFIQVHQKVELGRVALADTLLNIIKVDSANLWCNSYGKASSLARGGLELMKRYLQNGNDLFKDLGLGIADLYLGSRPVCVDYYLRPTALSAAIDLQIHAYELTENKQYLDQALAFGAMAKDMFMDESSPLPKVFAEKFDHYEAISGGADLMLSFYNLAKLDRKY